MHVALIDLSNPRTRAMDWFERLTGFRETSYDDTRAKLKLDDGRLQSLINGESYGIGELELVPLQGLRERLKSADGQWITRETDEGHASSRKHFNVLERRACL